MIARHQSAYKFAFPFVKGKRILDIGCGEGYGSFYLAGAAREVLGVDYDTSAVTYARGKYLKDNLQFAVVDVKNLASLDKHFDVICCFQVIEHIRDDKGFLASVKHLLADSGIFICSTPNKLDASPNSTTPCNKFHCREYLLEEYKTLLTEYFTRVEILGLKRSRELNFFRRLKKIGIFKALPKRIDPVKKFYDRISTRHFTLVHKNIERALDFIAVCGNNQC